MRIISGKFKNKKLHFPKNLKTRPLKDSVRENIFNILKHSNKIEITQQNKIINELSKKLIQLLDPQSKITQKS